MLLENNPLKWDCSLDRMIGFSCNEDQEVNVMLIYKRYVYRLHHVDFLPIQTDPPLLAGPHAMLTVWYEMVGKEGEQLR